MMISVEQDEGGGGAGQLSLFNVDPGASGPVWTEQEPDSVPHTTFMGILDTTSQFHTVASLPSAARARRRRPALGRPL
jgi:hypothetical protein